MHCTRRAVPAFDPVTLSHSGDKALVFRLTPRGHYIKKLVAQLARFTDFHRTASRLVTFLLHISVPGVMG